MSRLVVFPRGQLSSKDKERFTKMGIVWAEADDPTQVREIAATTLTQSVITGDGIILAALKAMAQESYGAEVRSGFVKNLYQALAAAEPQRSTPTASGNSATARSDKREDGS